MATNAPNPLSEIGLTLPTDYERVEHRLIDEFYQDAVRVIAEGIALVNVTTVDKASLINARLASDSHRDATQIIPRAAQLFNQQYAGAEIIDLLIEGCVFVSPWSKQQPIYAGDGLLRRPTIINNRMFTQSDHEITIAALSGCIYGNWANGRLAKIKLKGLRINGKPKKVPSIKVLSFSNDGNVYEPFRNFIHDSPSCVTDERGKIKADDAIYLEDFDLHGFRLAAEQVCSHGDNGIARGANAMCVDFHKIALNFGKRHIKQY